MAVEVKKVVFDEKDMKVYIYLEDKDSRCEYIERLRTKDINGDDYLRPIEYDLKNPNKAVDLGFKLRKNLTNHDHSGSEIYKEFKTWDSWLNDLVGVKVNLNEYGQLA